MLRFLTQTDADLHAIAANRWASPYERATQAASIVSTCFEVEHEVVPKYEIKFDLAQVVLYFDVAVDYDTVVACPTIKYGNGILSAVHGFSVQTKRNKSGTTLRYTATVEHMNATFNFRRGTSVAKWFLQTTTLGMTMFFLFLGGVRLMYGSEDEDLGVDDPWEVLDE
tara:strand:+ start:118 stop:621 length:504 start_codon:yes stop_codon:yes gene_type:complete